MVWKNWIMSGVKMSINMNGIKFKFQDFEGMYTEFNTIIGILEDNIIEYNNIIEECDNLIGTSFLAYKNNMQECKNDAQKIIDTIKSTQTTFEDIKDLANNNYKPICTERPVELDINVLSKSIQRVIEILSGEDLKSVIEENVDVTQWIVDRHNELDDTFLETILNPVDECKQGQAEKVFRENEKLYNKAIESMREDIMFEDEIDNLENELKKTGKFDELFDSIKGESLFDAFAMSVVGYNSSTFEEMNIEQYKTAEQDSKIEASNEKINDIHMLLDVCGLVAPLGISQISDAANAILYLLEGKGGQCLLSLFSALPLIGVASGSAKCITELKEVSKGSKYTTDAIHALDIKSIMSASEKEAEVGDFVLDLTFKPIINICVGAATGSAYGMAMPGITVAWKTLHAAKTLS